MRIFNENLTEKITNYDRALYYVKNAERPLDSEEFNNLSTEEKRNIIFDIDKNIEYVLKLVPYTQEELDKREIAQLRGRRAILLTAFDKWEKAVLRGREEDSADVMEWYQKLLDLDETAFTDANIPERVKYYL